jgi:hypothetical protein
MELFSQCAHPLGNQWYSPKEHFVMGQQTANPGLGIKSPFITRTRPKDTPVQAPAQAANPGELQQQALATHAATQTTTGAKTEDSDTPDSTPDSDNSVDSVAVWSWLNSDTPEGLPQPTPQPNSNAQPPPPERDAHASHSEPEQSNSYELAPFQSKREQVLSGFFQMPVPGRETQNAPHLKEQAPKTSTSIFSARPKVALRVSATKKQKREGQSFAVASSEPDVGSNVAPVYETGLFMTESEEDQQTPSPGEDEKPMKIIAPTAPAAARCPHDAYATPPLFNGLHIAGDIT